MLTVVSYNTVHTTTNDFFRRPPMLIYRLISYSAHPHLSDRCEAIEQHSTSIHLHSRKSHDNILVTCFILATSRSHACAFGFLLTDNHYSAFNRDSSYLSLE
jgi:hypothetical protein